MKKLISMMIVAATVTCGLSIAKADSPKLIDRATGKYLGNLNANRYDPESINNPYSKYGNKYNTESVNNPYGRYGSKYSNDSVNNPYATNAPAIYGDE